MKYRILKRNGKFKIQIRSKLFFLFPYWRDYKTTADSGCSVCFVPAYFDSIEEAQNEVQLIKKQEEEKKAKSEPWNIVIEGD